jgi:4-hydroxy-3-methylbut-2-enyl diphosphate reductase
MEAPGRRTTYKVEDGDVVEVTELPVLAGGREIKIVLPQPIDLDQDVARAMGATASPAASEDAKGKDRQHRDQAFGKYRQSSHKFVVSFHRQVILPGKGYPYFRSPRARRYPMDGLNKVILAAPRGFCAGVAYAIEVVDLALRVYGAPLYVRHAIVHNEWVVSNFEKRGVIFIENIEDIPNGSTVVFSAHGVAPAVREAAKERSLNVIDATCPLVTKVHREAARYAAQGYAMLYIGHRGHVEAEGTMGEAPGRMILIDNVAEAEIVMPPEGKLAVVTQTTLSVDEVERILSVLKRRFPHLELPPKEDICYATTNRQIAVKALADKCDLVLVVGSKTSSNSNRLREVAASCGKPSFLIMSSDEVLPEWSAFDVIGVTSGASTPEALVEEIVGKLLQMSPWSEVAVSTTVDEDVTFIPPRDLIALARSQ